MRIGDASLHPIFDGTFVAQRDCEPGWFELPGVAGRCHLAGIGADTSAIDRLVANPRLDVDRADPRADQPCRR